MQAPRPEPPTEIPGTTSRRLLLLQPATRSRARGSSLRREVLLHTSDDAFERPETLLLREAMARRLCAWLDERHLPWPFCSA